MSDEVVYVYLKHAMRIERMACVSKAKKSVVVKSEYGGGSHRMVRETEYHRVCDSLEEAHQAHRETCERKVAIAKRDLARAISALNHGARVEDRLPKAPILGPIQL
jgi:hypothetical protein